LVHKLNVDFDVHRSILRVIYLIAFFVSSQKLLYFFMYAAVVTLVTGGQEAEGLPR
jgi:hypothetical protein